jgi:hypothetical protein
MTHVTARTVLTISDPALSLAICAPFCPISRDICGRNTTRTPLPAPILLPHTSAKQGTTSSQRRAQNPDHTILPSGWDASQMAAPLLLGAITTLQMQFVRPPLLDTCLILALVAAVFRTPVSAT